MGIAYTRFPRTVQCHNLLYCIGVIEGHKAYVEAGYVEMKLYLDEYGPTDGDMIYVRGHAQLVPEDGIIEYIK